MALTFLKYKNSFRFRLFGIFTVTTALITALFTFLLIEREIQFYRLQAAEKAHLLASLLANTIRLPLYAEDRNTLEQLAQETAQKPEVKSIFIFNQDGKMLVNLAKQQEFEADAVISISVAVKPAALATSAESALTGIESKNSKPFGTVRIDLNSKDLLQKTRELVFFATSMALLFWLSVLSISFLALKRATRSFNTLMQGVESIGKGDYSVRIPIESDDEPEQVAKAVNDLAATLQKRDEENRQLQTELLNAMKVEVQEERKQVMAKLIQTNRMTSLGLLVSSMAHEINNPNGAIRLAAQYMNRAWKDTLPILHGLAKEEGDFSLGGIPLSIAGEEIARSGENIVRNTERIEKVIQNLRAYSLGGGKEFRPGIDINLVVKGALAVIRAHSRHGALQIEVQPDPYLPTINGNRHQLEQVVINLVLNAIHAMPEASGTITIATGLDEQSGHVKISVKDEGVGIPPENLERIFEPFFSTRIDSGGSGLGLYISKFIIGEHRGLLEVVSESASGSIFTIRLPISQESA